MKSASGSTDVRNARDAIDAYKNITDAINAAKAAADEANVAADRALNVSPIWSYLKVIRGDWFTKKKPLLLAECQEPGPDRKSKRPEGQQ